MERIFEKFRNEAETLAAESNAEVEIIVKYSFKRKPNISSAFKNDRGRWTNAVDEQPGNKNLQKSLAESSTTYVQIRNPGSRPPPLSTGSKEVIPEQKSAISSEEPSSGQIVPVKTISSTSGQFVHDKFVSSSVDEADASYRIAEETQSAASCIIGRFVDDKFEAMKMQNNFANASSKMIDKNENYFHMK